MNKLKVNLIIFGLSAAIVGTLLHFAYDWVGGPFFKLIGATDESVFSHLKLLFWPMVFLGVIEYFIYGKKYSDFLAIRIIAITIAILITVTVFYSYTGIFGSNYVFVDIPLFYMAVFAAYLYTCRSLTKPRLLSKPVSTITYIWFLLLLLAFILFSYVPPQLPFFKETLLLF